MNYQDDEELLGAVASAIKTLKPTENALLNKTSHEKNVSTANTTKQKPYSKNQTTLNNKSYKIIKINKIQSDVVKPQLFAAKTLKKVLGQSMPNSKNLSTNSNIVAQQRNNPIHVQLPVILGAESLARSFATNDKLPQKMISTQRAPQFTVIPNTTSIKYSTPLKQVATKLTAPTTLTVPTTPTAPTKSTAQNIVNRFKYKNWKDFTNYKQLPVKKKKIAQTEDDDCILLDEPATTKLTHSKLKNVVRHHLYLMCIRSNYNFLAIQGSKKYVTEREFTK